MDAILFSDSEQDRLKQLGVKVLFLFGSRASGAVSEGSDYDVAVLLAPLAAAGVKHRTTLYTVLYDLLSDKIQKLVDIDIVFLRDAPMELRAHVMKYGVVLFEQRQGIVARFREEVMDTYADFAPIRRMFHQEIIRRIPA